MNQNIMGIDIGNGYCKGARKHRCITQPSIVAPTHETSIDELPAYVLTNNRHVLENDEGFWMVGEGADVSGQALQSMGQSRFENLTEYRTLFQFLIGMLNVRDTQPKIVTGLALNEFVKTVWEKAKSAIVGRHQFCLDGVEFDFDIASHDVTWVPQSVGTFYHEALTGDGTFRKNTSVFEGVTAVLDFGTNDMNGSLWIDGIFQQDQSVTAIGSRNLMMEIRARLIQQFGPSVPSSFSRLNSIFESGILRIGNTQHHISDLLMEATSSYVRGALSPLYGAWGDLNTVLQNVLIGGGLAKMVFPHLHKPLSNTNRILSNRPQEANALGFYKIGVKTWEE